MIYAGSHIFSFLSESSGIPLDQLNFLITQFIALVSGIFFRSYLKPCPQNSLKRHLVAILGGILLGHFCYGKQMWHLFFQAFVSYGFLHFIPRQYVHLVTIVFTMSYLSGMHIGRMVYDYGNYTLDVTGPLMVSTQKLTALAFAYYDGMRREEKLSADQKAHAIKDRPHVIEFLSYLFNFQGIVVGPLSFYQDYIDFITGKNILKHKKDTHDQDANRIIDQPSIKIPLLKKFLTFLLLGVVFFKVTIVYPISTNLNAEVLEKPIWYRVIYLYVSTSSQRARYYIAWVLADLVNNASGFGFNGYDANGNAKWDLISNINIMKLETATSMKVVFDSWNVQTQIWLRRICYDRVPTLKTMGVFVLSAIWHGFYPGYYCTFVTGGFAVYAGRGIRRKIRPFFQSNQIVQLVYSVLTWAGTAFTLAYSVAPFDLVEFWVCMKFYNTWFWWLTIFLVGCTIILPGGSTKPARKPAADAKQDITDAKNEAGDAETPKKDEEKKEN